MTLRIDEVARAGEAVLQVEGRVDAQAMALIQRAVAKATRRPVRVVLRYGTEVEPGCIPALRALENAEVIAESPFLSRWLACG